MSLYFIDASANTDSFKRKKNSKLIYYFILPEPGYFTGIEKNTCGLKQCLYTLKNQSLKITQLEKVHFIKVNELKLTQDELF